MKFSDHFILPVIRNLTPPISGNCRRGECLRKTAPGIVGSNSIVEQIGRLTLDECRLRGSGLFSLRKGPKHIFEHVLNFGRVETRCDQPANSRMGCRPWSTRNWGRPLRSGTVALFTSMPSEW